MANIESEVHYVARKTPVVVGRGIFRMDAAGFAATIYRRLVLA